MFDINGLMEKVSKVNIKGGVVGKVCTSVMFVSACLAVVGYSSSQENIKLISMVIMGVVASVFLWRVISFADRHPQAALLEGSEFIVHEQMKMGSKETPVIEVDPSDRAQAEPVIDAELVEKLSRMPDERVTVIEHQNEAESR